MKRLVSILVLLLASCGGEGEEATVEEARCAQCGMLVHVAPQWQAGLGDAEAFDSPKCLFRWSGANGRDTDDGWVTEYYSSERTPIVEVLFVVGSDVLSPMGDDLVPVEGRVRAELFARDHGGRIVTPGQIDAVLLRSLDPGR